MISMAQSKFQNMKRELQKFIEDRTKYPVTIKTLMDHYRGRKSANLKKNRLKIEVHTLKEGILLGFGISDLIVDTVSKDHRALDISDAAPEFKLAKDVIPRYELYSRDGRKLKNQQQLLAQA